MFLDGWYGCPVPHRCEDLALGLALEASGPPAGLALEAGGPPTILKAGGPPAWDLPRPRVQMDWETE